jgi:hypothetical protein
MTQEEIKSIAIDFAEWISEECIESFTGFVLRDSVDPSDYSGNEYSISELWDIYKAQKS